MATSLTLQNDPTLQQGYLKVNGTTAATITTSGISTPTLTASGVTTPTLNTVSVDDYTILSDFIGSNQSLSTNGWQKLPGGLIMQWGSVSYADIGTYLQIPVTFPISFSGLTNPYVFAIADTSQFAVSCTVNNRFKTTANIVIREYDTTIAAGTITYIAIGY